MTARPTPDFDLAIVGASFAGLVAAKTAAMRGLKVVVLDAKPDAGDRVATTGILVKEAAEEIDIPHNLTRRVHGVRLYAPNLSHVDLFAPGYFFLTTDTAALLRWLAHEAERAGATILYRAKFVGAARQDDRFRFQGFDVTARYILGADGGRSAVAQHFGLGRNRRFLTGLEIEFENLNTADPRFLHCFMNSKLAPGYLAWIACGPEVAQVGLAVGPGRRPCLKRFLAATEHRFDYSSANIVGRRSGRIPCGGLVYPWATRGVMLVGDAAGQVSPATAGGIQLAFRYGRRAAQAIADHLQNLGPDPSLALAGEMPNFAMKKIMRMMLDCAPPNAALNLMLGTRAMQLAARYVYFHKRGAHGLDIDEFQSRLDAERESSGGVAHFGSRL
jgi:digeranylgeranylglycerophospholipid reductase